jgi:hypothetical protein
MAGTAKRIRLLTTVAMVAVSAACGGGSGAHAEMEDHAVAATAARKRAPPADVPPVTRQGLRYEVVHWGKGRGLPQNGGYVAVVDAASGEELRLIRLYEIEYDPAMEGDKQDIFLTRMAIGCRGGCLEVADERGREYRVEF